MIEINKETIIKTFMKFPKRNILLIFFFLGFSEWLISDVIHFSGGSIGFMSICLVGYFYIRNDAKPSFNEPKDLKGWVALCNNDLKFFDELEEENNIVKRNSIRKNQMDLILNKNEKQKIYLVGQNNPNKYINLFNDYFPKENNDLYILNDMPAYNSTEKLPTELLDSDSILYNLNLPLTAKNFLWLEKFPQDISIWLTLPISKGENFKTDLINLKEEIPQKFIKNIIYIDSNINKLTNIPISFRKFLFNPVKNIEKTKKRLLKQLHQDWQSEIEAIRRGKLKGLQRKNQILVAASVFASPVPSIDVLSMTVLNSLMIKEIKTIYGCKWSPEILDKVTREIIKTAISQGIIEWSSQAFFTVSKLHASTWLLTGSFQAISAAYLTRVVSRSLADFMAISNGLKEPDLEFIKRNSEKIVDNAFESEKFNWTYLVNDLKNSLQIKYSQIKPT